MPCFRTFEWERKPWRGMVGTVAVIDDDCFSVQECVQAISCGSSIEETMYIGYRSVNVHTFTFSIHGLRSCIGHQVWFEQTAQAFNGGGSVGIPLPRCNQASE